MKIRTKTFLVVVSGGFVLYVAWALIAWAVITPRFTRLEREDADDNGKRLHEAVSQQLGFLADKVVDWGAWDDAYHWTVGKNPGFADGNLLPETCRNLKIQGIAFVDLKGGVYGSCRAEETGPDPFTDIDLSPAGTLSRLVGQQRAAAGLVAAGERILLVAAHRIIRTDNSGDPTGMVLMVRQFDPALAAKLADLIRLPVRVERWKPADGTSEVHRLLDEGHLETRAILSDITGKPLLSVWVGDDRRFNQLGREALIDLLLGGGVVGLVLAVITILSLELLIVHRLVRLEREVKSAEGGPEGKDAPRPITVEGTDEVATLARAIHHSLTTIARAGDAARAGERRFIALFDGSADAVLVVDNGVVVQANPAAALVLGTSSSDDLVGEAYNDLVPKRLGSTTTIGSSGTVREVETRSLDGRHLVLQIREARVTVDGRMLVQAILHDRTLEAEREHSLQAAREAAEQATRAKETFLAMASHELRTPLNGVIGMASLLAEQRLPPEAGEQVATIRLCADMLLALVNDLLDLTRLEASGMPLERIPFDPRQVANEAVQMVRGSAEAKGLEIRVEPRSSPAGPIHVLGDPTRFRQVLLNLSANAVKFTERGGVSIAVELSPGQRTVRMAVEVSDTGIGIPASVIPHLFQPFQQADGSTTRRFGGTGLGLAISQRLVRLMGGKISVSSEVGFGATFSFVLDLPLAEPTPADVPVPVLPAPPTVSRDVPVLVVDDTESNRVVVTAMLTLIGCEVVAVAGAEEAEQAFREGRFALVLMDGMLDGVDGFTATARLRRIEQEAGWPRSVILGLSALDADVESERIRASGMDGFLAKPITVDQLRGELRRFGLIADGDQACGPAAV